MSGRSPRDKGTRAERRIVSLHVAAGVPSKRVPLSGSMPGWAGDLTVSWPGRGVIGEVKARRNGEGFKAVRDWLVGRDVLFLVQDRAEPIVAMRWRDYEYLLRRANGDRATDATGGGGLAEGRPDDPVRPAEAG